MSRALLSRIRKLESKLTPPVGIERLIKFVRAEQQRGTLDDGGVGARWREYLRANGLKDSPDLERAVAAAIETSERVARMASQ
jgi:hypothetical protein